MADLLFFGPNIFFTFWLQQFREYAHDIADAAENEVIKKIEIARSLSISITSYASDRGHPFPFVTVPDFEVRASKARELSGSEAIVWSPFVDKSQLRAWENYSIHEAPVWLRDSLDASGRKDEKTPKILPFVHSLGKPVGDPIFSDPSPLAQKYSLTWYVLCLLVVVFRT